MMEPVKTRILLANVVRLYPFYGAQEDVPDKDRFIAKDHVGFWWDLPDGLLEGDHELRLDTGEWDYGNRANFAISFLDRETGRRVYRFMAEIPIDWASPDCELQVTLTSMAGDDYGPFALLRKGRVDSLPQTRPQDVP